MARYCKLINITVLLLALMLPSIASAQDESVSEPLAVADQQIDGASQSRAMLAEAMALIRRDIAPDFNLQPSCSETGTMDAQSLESSAEPEIPCTLADVVENTQQARALVAYVLAVESQNGRLQPGRKSFSAGEYLAAAATAFMGEALDDTSSDPRNVFHYKKRDYDFDAKKQQQARLNTIAADSFWLMEQLGSCSGALNELVVRADSLSGPEDRKLKLWISELYRNLGSSFYIADNSCL